MLVSCVLLVFYSTVLAMDRWTKKRRLQGRAAKATAARKRTRSVPVGEELEGSSSFLHVAELRPPVDPGRVSSEGESSQVN